MENEYVGTYEAAQITGLTQQTIQKRCRTRYYESAEHDAPNRPWRILKQEVLNKLKMKRRK